VGVGGEVYGGCSYCQEKDGVARVLGHRWSKVEDDE